MINFDRLWKDFKYGIKNKREIKDLKYSEINLKDYIIIDVRSKREYEEEHINGAINIPLHSIRKNITNQNINKQDKILVYCQSGIRSKKAVIILESLEFKYVYNLDGGLENI